MNVKLFLKIGMILFLIVALMIPLAMVGGVVSERSSYRNSVAWDVARTWTGQQSIKGPLLSVPYEIEYEQKTFNKETEKYEYRKKLRTKVVYLIPEQLSIDGDIATENRKRGIYTVPVYNSELRVSGHFSTEELKQISTSEKGFVRWLTPTASVVIDDVRGIGSRPSLRWNTVETVFEAGSTVPNLNTGLHAKLPTLPHMQKLPFAIELELRGSQQFMVSPVAKDVNVELRSTWPHPKFDGEFLPTKHTITDSGFIASWQTSSFSTDAETKLASCIHGDCGSLNALKFGAAFIEPVDIYSKVNRAIKYGILFIVLTFVAFFLTETLSSQQLHPVQYALVGFSLAIFYLLLVSLSEHFGFLNAYLSATASCAALVGVYMSGVLGSAKQGMLYSLAIVLLYAMLYAILRSEDFALLMGTLLLFAMLAIVMLLTRKVNWYDLKVLKSEAKSTQLNAQNV